MLNEKHHNAADAWLITDGPTMFHIAMTTAKIWMTIQLIHLTTQREDNPEDTQQGEDVQM